jgi:hypothetical protein
MDTHVKVLGVLYIALNALGVLAALFLLLTLGGTAGIVGAAADAQDAAIAIPIIGITGMALVILLLAVSLPGLLAGWGLLNYKPWARILAIVVAILHLLNIPFGTLVGVYALWVLLNKDTERLFQPTVRPVG